MVAHEWKKFETFDEFLDEFERYVNEYFTKNIILVNQLKMEKYDGGDVIQFALDTPSTDIWLRIFVPDRVIIDSYINIPASDILIADDWNGMVLSEEQYSRFLRIFMKAHDYYIGNKEEFKKARAEAFMNLIVGTKGRIIDAMEKELGKETTALVIAKELGVLPKERESRGSY